MNSPEAVSYVYEYMVRRCMPFIKVPPVLNTVAVQVRHHHKVQEFIFAYDREGLKDVMAILIQNYSSALFEFDELIINNFATSPPILKKYSFDCRNVLLLEFFDFLNYNQDDFITTIKVKVSSSLNLIEFWVGLDSIMVLDSKGFESKELSDRMKSEWKVWKVSLNHTTDFGQFIDASGMGVNILYAATFPVSTSI